MSSFNKVILVGRLGSNPSDKLNHTDGGTAVINISIVTTNGYYNQDDEWEEEAEWHNLTFWDRSAEIIAEYLDKGDPIMIESRVQYDEWHDENDKRHKRAKFHVRSPRQFTLLGSGGGKKSGGSSGGGKQQSFDSEPEPSSEPDEDFEFEEDDALPF